jgi:hypothetical protein
MASIADICNMALSHLGVSDQITELDTETSKEALACRLWYEPCRDQVLRSFPWPFATIVEDLALVETDPNEGLEWAYSYRYPAACLKLRRILSGVRTDSQSSKVPMRVVRDDTGRLILTDLEDAQVEYTQLVDDSEEFDALFVDALSYLLAAKIGARVTGGDQFKLSDRAMQLYVYTLALAQNVAADEERSDEDPDAEIILSRT